MRTICLSIIVVIILTDSSTDKCHHLFARFSLTPLGEQWWFSSVWFPSPSPTITPTLLSLSCTDHWSLLIYFVHMLRFEKYIKLELWEKKTVSRKKIDRFPYFCVASLCDLFSHQLFLSLSELELLFALSITLEITFLRRLSSTIIIISNDCLRKEFSEISKTFWLCFYWSLFAAIAVLLSQIGIDHWKPISTVYIAICGYFQSLFPFPISTSRDSACLLSSSSSRVKCLK